MKVPNADRAIIAEAKLRDYLLSRRHPLGRFKAAFLLGLGYTEENWARLEADLRSQHLSLDVEAEQATAYGRKFVIAGPLAGPSGTTAAVISVWVIRNGEDFPRFVTAYPAGATA